MKVLITGSSGFIGAAVTRAVVAKGDEVRVLIRPTSNPKNLEGLPVEIIQ
ncbi:MAG: NmrA family NAD(P)-binding protein, partial [Nitrospira sp.]|nr:NmrA family NAD(P)-binding protein [Nitrospira sp.]